jgi:hypothetical protein
MIINNPGKVTDFSQPVIPGRGVKGEEFLAQLGETAGVGFLKPGNWPQPFSFRNSEGSLDAGPPGQFLGGAELLELRE